MHQVFARSLLLGSVLTLWLTGCGEPLSPAVADPYAGGVNHGWSSSAPTTDLSGLSLTAGTNNLYHEPILSARNAWGPIELNRSNGEQAAGDGKTLTLNGQQYARGFGTHAGSELRFSLKGSDATCTNFTAQIGVDDEVGSQGSVVFQVLLDGVKTYDSGTMTGTSASKTVNLDVTGKQDLRLVVTDAGDGINFDHANWVNPLISCQAAAATAATAPSVTLDRSALSIYHLHTGTLKATFAGYAPGTVSVELEAPAAGVGPGGNNLYPYPLVLQTTSLTLSGAASETHDLVIAAPQKFGFADYSSNFHLVIKRNGVILNRLPVQLTELPIKFTASLDTPSISGRPGEVKNLVLTVTADPPLDRAYPLSIGFQDFPGSKIQVAGPVTGTGARMQVPLTFQIVSYGSATTEQVRAGIAVGDITTGYRDILYAGNPSIILNFTILP
ncbi:NPCBM/NEW2 domain-containing protein [Deinococcus sp. QL22]|uniref:NPCBM/NEW2 domain-containing protein n=1 Tax=Deinococcus sp. QL22 TaxID=2939437 RepID=UPI0020181911|nr:NPCBM/NEW2 domain-containing protein [Deinococcus sp. QL22]UQN09608.1 NPCBM/NEW2 domain-containing protein [Deinococcus sp. QL22]